jgi:hypothetical protein
VQNAIGKVVEALLSESFVTARVANADLPGSIHRAGSRFEVTEQFYAIVEIDGIAFDLTPPRSRNVTPSTGGWVK